MIVTYENGDIVFNINNKAQFVVNTKQGLYYKIYKDVVKEKGSIENVKEIPVILEGIIKTLNNN